MTDQELKQRLKDEIHDTAPDILDELTKECFPAKRLHPRLALGLTAAAVLIAFILYGSLALRPSRPEQETAAQTENVSSAAQETPDSEQVFIEKTNTFSHLSSDAAVSIALSYAKVSPDHVKNIKTEESVHNGANACKVTFSAEDTLYEINVNTDTGEVFTDEGTYSNNVYNDTPAAAAAPSSGSEPAPSAGEGDPAEPEKEPAAPESVDPAGTTAGSTDILSEDPSVNPDTASSSESAETDNAGTAPDETASESTDPQKELSDPEGESETPGAGTEATTADTDISEATDGDPAAASSSESGDPSSGSSSEGRDPVTVPSSENIDPSSEETLPESTDPSASASEASPSE